jgi:hypothetical protein
MFDVMGVPSTAWFRPECILTPDIADFGAIG